MVYFKRKDLQFCGSFLFSSIYNKFNVMEKNMFSFFNKKNKEPEIKIFDEEDVPVIEPITPVDESAELASIVLSPSPEEEISEEEKPEEKTVDLGLSRAQLRVLQRLGKLPKIKL